MPTNTLTSLAILRVQVNHNGDYLTYLEPFILQVLADCGASVVTTNYVTDSLERRFGITIPDRPVELVLRRFARQKILTRGNNEFRITGAIPDPQLTSKQADAQRHIRSVITGIQRFSSHSVHPMEDEEEIVEAVCAFLSEFDVSCLRSYLRGTAIPEAVDASSTDKTLVSNYVQSIHLNEPERFNSFLVLVQGHMLANALVCTDLENTPKSFSGVTFYLDTPLLIRRLGLEGETKREAAAELIALLRNLGGSVAAFSHSREELGNVIQGAATYLESTEGRGAIIQEARRAGTTRSDLILLAETADEKLAEAHIAVLSTPGYTQRIQIDEAAFEQVLIDEVSYFNPRAKEYDVNSVRSIYVQRNKKHVPSLEKSHAVFVTSNSAFAKAAWQYGQQYAPSQAASTVITDFTLANLAWLKAPMGGPAVPTTQLMSFCYAALQPSRELLGKYLNEIEKLEEQETFPERDLQLLRSSPLVSNELMNLTMGDDELLTEETVTEILERVTGEIKREETDRADQLEIERLNAQQALEEETGRSEQLERERLKAERALEEQSERSEQLERERSTTLEALEVQRVQNNRIVSNLYWDCQKKAKRQARGIVLALSVLLIAVIVVSQLQITGLPPEARWPITGIAIVLMVANTLFGLTMKGIYPWIENTLHRKDFQRQSRTLGIDIEDVGAIPEVAS